MATKEETEREVRREVRAEIRAEEKTEALKEENRALKRASRAATKLAKDLDEKPNVLQVAATGTCAIAGVAGGIATHRKLRQVTADKIEAVDPKDAAVVAAVEAYKKGEATPEQLKTLEKNAKRTVSAVIVSEGIPITVGLTIGAICGFFSDSGIVVAIGGGGGFGFAAGVLIDLIFPGPAPIPMPKKA